jgi:hypothetical protein
MASSLTIPTLQAEPAQGHGFVTHLSNSLGLDDAQKSSIQAVFDAQFKPALQQIHATTRANAKPVIDGVMQQVQTKLSPPLTAEQLQDLASIQRVRAARVAAAASGQGKGGRWAHHRRGLGKREAGGRLAMALGLTDAQKTQVQGFFAAAKPQLKAIRQDARAQTQASMTKFYAQIAQNLTAQQQQDLASMQRIRERMRAAWQAKAAKES